MRRLHANFYLNHHLEVPWCSACASAHYSLWHHSMELGELSEPQNVVHARSYSLHVRMCGHLHIIVGILNAISYSLNTSCQHQKHTCSADLSRSAVSIEWDLITNVWDLPIMREAHATTPRCWMVLTLEWQSRSGRSGDCQANLLTKMDPTPSNTSQECVAWPCSKCSGFLTVKCMQG